MSNEILKESNKNWQNWPGVDIFINSNLDRVNHLPISQSFLMSGRIGLDKQKYAAALIALFYCATKNACGHCAACKSIIFEHNSDVLWIEDLTEKNLKNNHAQLIQEHLSIGSSESNKPRAVVIVGADRLTLQAANRLLKTVEEPPKNSLIIFISTAPAKVIKTIRSRCGQIRLPAVSSSTLATWLSTHYEVWNEINENEQVFILERSCGAPAIALELLTNGSELKASQKYLKNIIKVEPQARIQLIKEYIDECEPTLEQVLEGFEYSQNEFLNSQINADIKEESAGYSIINNHKRRLLLTNLRRHKSPFNVKLLLERLYLSR